jgi:hypothetical protein
MGTGITQAAPRHPRNGPLAACSHPRGGTTNQGLCGGVGHTWGVHNTRGRLKNMWGNVRTTGGQQVFGPYRRTARLDRPKPHHTSTIMVPVRCTRGNGAPADGRGHASCGKAPSHPRFCASTLLPTPCGSERDACASGMPFLESRAASPHTSMDHVSGERAGGSWEGAEGPGAATGRGGGEGLLHTRQGKGAATHQTRLGAPPKPPAAPPGIAPVPIGPYGSWEMSPQAVASCGPAWGPGTRPFAQEVPAREKRVGKRVSGSRRRGLVPSWQSTHASHSLPPHPHVRKPIRSASRGRGAPYHGCPALQSAAPPPLPANCQKRGRCWR